MRNSLEGKLSPVFELPFTGGKTLNSDDLIGKKYILFFYPKDNTPG